MTDMFESITPNQEESHIAQESSRRLAELLGEQQAGIRLQVHPDGKQGEEIALPLTACHLLVEILDEMGKGNPVAFIPMSAELTTQQAAEILNVSRPYLVQLLEAGTIPHRKVGAHRRVRHEDVMRFKQQDDQDRHKALEELSAEAQELHLGY